MEVAIRVRGVTKTYAEGAARVIRIEDGAVSSVKNLRQLQAGLPHSIPSSHSDLQSTLARPL
jgi:hypothetical protein